MKRFLLLLMIASFPLFADDLTEDPPIPWETSCPPCGPPLVCDPCIPSAPIAEFASIDLVDPIYEGGVLSTEKGGVLTGEGLRIQARKIIYTRKKDCDPPVYTIYCEGDLLINYKGRVLLGETFFYDFTTQSGMLTNGKTASPPWYVGGDLVRLLENGDLEIEGGYITTSEKAGDPDVVLRAPRLTLTRNQILTAYGVNFRVSNIPLFYLPKISLDLTTFGESPFSVEFGWGGYLGTHIGIRYQFLEWGHLKGYARLDGYLGRGLGGGIETTYEDPCSFLKAYTRSYFAHDISIDDPERKNRYRFQGTLYDRLWHETTSLEVLYDVVSDAQMAADYTSNNFDLTTANRTQLELRRDDELWIARFFTRARVNSFQSVNQELPSFALFWHPVNLFETGIIAENTFKVSYLNYVFSDDIKRHKDFHSGRLEVKPFVYRPFYLDPFILTPEAGFIGIAYSNNPHGNSVGQALGSLGLRAETSLSRCYGSYKHAVEPYAHYHLYTEPRANLRNQYIFTIDDAYAHLQYVRFGVCNSLFSNACRRLWVDLWGNAFIGARRIDPVVQKGYATVEWTPNCFLLLATDEAWNFEHQQLDFSNSRIEWTVSDDLAFGLEYRHRGRYAWRKADFDNFFLEARRDEEDLLASPLSERRDTLLFRTFYRLTPDWAGRFQMRHGWDRLDEPAYTEYLISLGTTLYQHWRLQFTFEKRESDTRSYVSLKLQPGPP